MHGPVKKGCLISNCGRSSAPHKSRRMRARVLIPKDSSITRIEIEVFAALLDDWNDIEPGAIEDHSK